MIEIDCERERGNKIEKEIISMIIIFNNNDNNKYIISIITTTTLIDKIKLKITFFYYVFTFYIE